MLIMATDPGAFVLPANQAMKMESDVLYDVIWDTFEGGVNQKYPTRRQHKKAQVKLAVGSTTRRRKKGINLE